MEKRLEFIINQQTVVEGLARVPGCQRHIFFIKQGKYVYVNHLKNTSIITVAMAHVASIT